MYHFELSSGLSIKELDPYNPKDIWLASKLDKDRKVKEYLWSIKFDLEKMKFRSRKTPYDIEYALYLYESPIGYFDFSKPTKSSNCKCVYESYALLKQARKHGYAAAALEDTSKLILTDTIDRVALNIMPENEESINVAFRAGFEENGKEDKYLHFEKTKAMLKRERCLH